MIFLRKVLLFGLISTLLLGSIAASARRRSLTIVVDAQTGYILEQVKADEEAPGRQPDQNRDGHGGARLGRPNKAAISTQVATIPPAALVGARENNVGFQPGDTHRFARPALRRARAIGQHRGLHPGRPCRAGAAGAIAAERRKLRGHAGRIFLSRQMNALAQASRDERTRFVNPSGVDNDVKPALIPPPPTWPA